VFPFFEAKLFSVWLKGQKAIKSIKVTIEDETPVSQEKYTSLLKQLRHMSREYADDLARKDDSCKVDLQIERDKTIEKQSEINSLDNKYEIYKEETDTTINDLQLEIERLHEELSELRESKQADLKPTPTSIEYAVLTSLVNAPSFTQADSTLLANYLGSSKLMAEDVIQEIINKGYCSERQTANSRLITITAIGKKYYKLLSTGTR
jgi:vacuolar-type H+-ATPase subunit I/STV1